MKGKQGDCGMRVTYCVMGFSGSRCLARGSAHGRGAVGAGALPHGQSARQLQLLEEGSPCDLSRLRTLAGAPRQHAAHHTQLHTERKHTVQCHAAVMLLLILSSISSNGLLCSKLM